MRPLLISLLLASATSMVACDTGGADVDFGGEETGEDLFVVHSDDGGVKLALTEENVYFALADSVRGEVNRELAEDTPSDGIGGLVSGAVRSTVSRAMSFRARIPVEEIEDIRWEDGRMVFEFVDPDRSMGERFRVDDRPVDEAFDEEAVQAFGQAFRALKRGDPIEGSEGT